MIGVDAVVRTLKAGERLPAELNTGFENLPLLDPNWVWVAEDATGIKATIIIAPIHGIAYGVRVASIGPKTILLPLMVKVCEDLLLRGYNTYVIPVGDAPDEAKIAKALLCNGGKIEGGVVLISGQCDEFLRRA